MLKVGDWENAQKIIKKLPEQSVVSNEPISTVLIDLIHLSIDHIYRTKCFKILTNSNSNTINNKSYIKRRLADDSKLVQKLQVNNYHDLCCYVIPMIVALGPTLYCDTVLMYKLIRILRNILQEMNMDGQNIPDTLSDEETLYNEVMTILDAAILPALSFLDCNCPMAEEIWSVVKHFPYHYR